MKLAALIPALLLAGCAGYGSWLDEVGKTPSPPVAMSDTKASELNNEAAALRAQAESIRAQLARETDRYRRYVHYRALHRIGEKVADLERSLRDADRPSRTTTAQPVPG